MKINAILFIAVTVLLFFVAFLAIYFISYAFIGSFDITNKAIFYSISLSFSKKIKRQDLEHTAFILENVFRKYAKHVSMMDDVKISNTININIKDAKEFKKKLNIVLNSSKAELINLYDVKKLIKVYKAYDPINLLSIVIKAFYNSKAQTAISKKISFLVKSKSTHKDTEFYFNAINDIVNDSVFSFDDKEIMNFLYKKISLTDKKQTIFKLENKNSPFSVFSKHYSSDPINTIFSTNKNHKLTYKEFLLSYDREAKVIGIVKINDKNREFTFTFDNILEKRKSYGKVSMKNSTKVSESITDKKSYLYSLS